MAAQPPIPPPELPGPLAALQGHLKSMYDAVVALQNPGAPVLLPEIDTAANLAANAPAADYPNHAIIVTDKTCIAVSTNVAGTWTWLRADGSAL